MTRFARTVALTALLSLPLCAQALTGQEASANASKSIATKPGLHLVLAAGLTFGGDTIATASYTDGSSKSIKGGGLAQFGLGASYQFQDTPLALLLSANYHYHTAAASNGDLTFSRIPVEVLAYYTGVERFRLGGGVRLVNSPETTMTIDGATEKITYDKTTGLVAELGYKIASSSWLNFRYVSEKYQGNTYTSTSGTTTSLASTPELDGSHFGISFAFEF
ncbi:MAG: hypothetical protein Q7U91_08175 [Sideroxyarcus sp.]|nr:hypothetical protein [Sideroxyarcus sp.]